MKLSKTRVTQSGKQIRLSAYVTSPSLDKKYNVWFETDVVNKKLLALGPEVFLPILLFMSMRFREDLVVEEPIRKDVHRILNKVTELVSSWTATDQWQKLYPVGIISPIVIGFPKYKNKGGKAAFFSLGVDSFYTLKKTDSKLSTQLTHLILVHGFDIALDNQKLFNITLKNAKIVASVTGKKLVVVRTNLKDIAQKANSWDQAHGTGLVAVSYFLSRGIEKVAINSEDAHVSNAPYGTNPQLDPLWSTKMVKIYSSGSGLKRSEKTRFIQDYTLAQKYLRVCFENPGGVYNCSRCQKCLRTMLQLDSFGVLDKFEHFSSKPPYHLLTSMTEPKHRLFLWRDLLRSLPLPRLHARWLIAKMIIRSYKKIIFQLFYNPAN